MHVIASHHIGLTVSAMDRSLDFYCHQLGAKLLLRREITTPWVGIVNGVPGAHLQVAFLDVFGQKIELLEFLTPQCDPLAPVANRPGTPHLTFLVDDLDAAFHELTAEGVRFVSEPQTNTEGPNAGSRVVFLFDPDDIRIEFVQPAPGRQQIP